MNSLLAMIAPLAIILPFAGGGDIVKQDTASLDPAVSARETAAPMSASSFDATYETPVQHQVRIEQRVVVRIAPRGRVERQNMVADLPSAPMPRRLVERKMEKCIPINEIAGVQTGSGNRLLLFLRDRRLVSANLEKACRARDFYSGFYVERHKDGRLCVDRDKLLSRSGANCEIERIRELVEANDR